MLDFKSDYKHSHTFSNGVEKIHFELDWYKILAQRPSTKSEVDHAIFDQILVTWRRLDYDIDNIKGIEKIDLENYYRKIGKILDIALKPETNKAIITFSSCPEAEFALITKEFTLKNHSIWAKALKGDGKKFTD